MSTKKMKSQQFGKKLVGVFLTLVLILSPQQARAFADVIGGQEVNNPTNTPTLIEEAPLGKDSSGVSQEEALTPFATATVTTEAAFRIALADVSVTEIYLGANISMSAAASATVANRPLVISGVDPLDPSGTVHTYADYPSSTAAFGGLQGTCIDLTFKDLNVTLSNFYGIYSAAVSNETVTFDNVTGTAPQFFHYYNASAGSTFIVKDSNLTLSYGYASTIGEFAEADRVIFRGNVTVTRAVPTVFNIFLLAGTYASVTVEDGAQVTIDNTANTTAGAAIFYAVNSITIGNDAAFYCYTAQGFTGAGAPAITVGQFSDVKFIYTGTAVRAAYFLQASSFSVGLQSSVLIYDNSNSAYGALNVTGSITLNSARSFVVLNTSNWVMGFLIPTNLTGNQVKSIRYFTASQIAGVYDSTTREYIGTDASPFSKWWIQNSPFNVSASSWPAATPTAVSSTPAYSAANVPAAALAAGAATTLTTSNFGLYSDVAYGYAIEGEQNATITLDYYLDGVRDPVRTTVITPSLLATLSLSDVILATPPLGYTLSAQPTVPTLPVRTQSINNTTVNVYYETDPTQTATINVNYFFDNVLDAARNTTITPQVLSSVEVSDVALATLPVGYRLALTPTSPALPAIAQNLNGTTVNVYYVTDSTLTATIDLEYYFDDIYNPSYDATITPQILSVVGVPLVTLATVPVGYTLSDTPTLPALPATALSLDNQTVSVYYETDPSQTATINVNYYFDNVLDTARNTTITPQVLSSVEVSDVALATPPPGYMLDTPPTFPVLPESALSLDGATVNVHYVTDPTQTATISVNYYFDNVYDPGLDTSLVRQVLTPVTLADVTLATTPTGYMLAPIPTDPVLPASALSLDGQTINVYYITDPTQTTTIAVNYYFNDTHDASYDDLLTFQVLSTVSEADVVLATTPTGYMLAALPTNPLLPASAQNLGGGTVNVYYVTDPTQTATFNIEYYFQGVHDTARDTTLTRQALESVTLEIVELSPVPVGYTLATDPTTPILPQTAYTLDGTTILVYYVLDVAQTASIDIGYYFDGVLDGSLSATINPQILASVTEADVVLGTTPTGYLLSTPPTDPALPQSALTLNNTTINVYYETDPAQTVSLDLQYFFDGIYDSSYDATITPQILTTVGLAHVALAANPEGYTLSSTPTIPTLPETAQNLVGAPIQVYYVTDEAQTATISVGYYFDGVLNAAYSTTIAPQILETVEISDVTLTTVPAGYILDTTPTSPGLPVSAQDLDASTVNVYYVTDATQTTTIAISYFFNGVYNPGLDASIERQILASVTLADVTLPTTPVGYMLDAVPTDPPLPAIAQSLSGGINVYYVTNPSQTVSINIAYYFNNSLNPAYNATITPHILSQVNIDDVVLSTTPAGYMLAPVPTDPTLPASAQSLVGQTVRVDYITDPDQTVSIDLRYYFDGVYDSSYDNTINPQALSTVGVANVRLAVVPIGYTFDVTPTSPAIPESALLLGGGVDVYYVTDAEQTAIISVGYYFNGVLDASRSTTITPQILATVDLPDVALSTVPEGYVLDTIATIPVLPESAQNLNGTTVSVYYVTDAVQTATIYLQYYFNGIHDPSFDQTITPQILSLVVLEQVILSTPPVDYLLDTPATSPLLPALASVLDNATVSVFYVTASERITAQDFRYPFALGILTGPEALFYAQVLAYDVNGLPIPASLLVVDMAQLAAINTAIAAGSTLGNPYPLTFYTPDGSSITISVTLFGGGSPGDGNGSSGSDLPNSGDQTGLILLLVMAGAALGILSLVYSRFRSSKDRVSNSIEQ